jgi:hypothetical protein
VGSALAPNTTWTILAPDNAAFTSRLNESLGITPQQLLLPENRATLVQVRQMPRHNIYTGWVKTALMFQIHAANMAEPSTSATFLAWAIDNAVTCL